MTDDEKEFRQWYTSGGTMLRTAGRTVAGDCKLELCVAGEVHKFDIKDGTPYAEVERMIRAALSWTPEKGDVHSFICQGEPEK